MPGHRAKNATNRKIDSSVEKQFKAAVIAKIKKWSAHTQIRLQTVSQACRMVRDDKFIGQEEIENKQFSAQYARDLLFQSNLKYTLRKSDQKHVDDASKAKIRQEMDTKLKQFNDPKYNILNADEPGFNLQKQRHGGWHAPDDQFKLANNKARVTFFPVISINNRIKFPPAFVIGSKARSKTAWASIKHRTVKKFDFKVKKKVTGKAGGAKMNKKEEFIDIEVEQQTITFENGSTCVLYNNSSKWMTQHIFELEMKRLSRYLRNRHPGQVFVLSLDNFSGHKSSDFSNLKLVFFEAGCTGFCQPCDQLLFGIMKQQYHTWLEQLLIDQIEKDETPKVSDGMCVREVVNIYNNLSEAFFNGSFKRSGLKDWFCWVILTEP